MSKSVCQEIHDKAAPFIKWLEEAEEEESEDDEDEEVEVCISQYIHGFSSGSTLACRADTP